MNKPHHKLRRKVLLSLAVASLVLIASVEVEHRVNPWLDPGAANFSMGILPHSQQLQSLSPRSQNSVQVFSFVLDLVNRLPVGTDMDQADFGKILTADMVKYLQAYQVQHIKVTAGPGANTTHLVVDLPSQQITTAKPSADLSLGPQISCDISRGAASGVLNLSNVQGVQAKVSWLVGWMTLQQMRFSVATNGDTVIELEFSTRFGVALRTVSVAADGTVTVLNGATSSQPNQPGP